MELSSIYPGSQHPTYVLNITLRTQHRFLRMMSLEEPPQLDQPKEDVVIDEKPSVSRSNSVDSSILVIDEDTNHVKEPDTTMEDDDLPPALESQPRAEEMEQVPVFEAPKVEAAEKGETKPSSTTKTPVPKITLTPNAVPVNGPNPSTLIPVTTISASVATAALNSLASSVPTSTSTATSAAPTTTTTPAPKKPRAPRKQTKKQPPATPQPQFLTPISGATIYHPGMPISYMPAGNMVFVSGKPALVHQGAPRPMQMDSKNGSPPTNLQRVQYIQQAPVGNNKNNMKMQPQLIQLPPGFMAQQQNRPVQQQQIQVKSPQFVNSGPLRQPIGECRIVPYNGRMVMLNQQNQIVGFCKVAQDSSGSSVMVAEPPPTLSPNPQLSSNGDKAPQAKKIKLAEAETGPSTSEKTTPVEVKPPVSFAPQMSNLRHAFKLAVPKGLLDKMGQTHAPTSMSNGNEEKPPAIEMASLFNHTGQAPNLQKRVFTEEASHATKYQGKARLKIHHMQGFTIQETDLTPPLRESNGIHNYILSPHSSSPSTPLSNPSLDIKEKKETEKKSELKSPVKDKVIQKPLKDNKAKPKVAKKAKVDKPAEVTPKLAPKVEKHPSSTPRKMPEHGVKKIKSAGNTPQGIEDKRLRKKNRELEGLLNMDFGPGKNPFKVGPPKTTSADTFRDEILISQQQIQKHVQAEEKPQPSEIRATSRTPAPPRRVGRPSHDKKAERPRRSLQAPGYKKLFDDDFEEEDNSDSIIDDDSERQSVKSQISEGGCLFCHKSGKSKKNPQYCKSECKRNYRKKLSLECQLQEKLGPTDLGAHQYSNGLEHSECSSTSSASRPPSTKPVAMPSLPSQPSPSRSSHPSTSAPQPIQKVAPIPELSKGNRLSMEELKKRPVASWNLDEVATWAGLVHCTDVVINELKDQEIDGDALVVLLQQQQLRSGLSLKLGPAVKLERDLRAILEEQKSLGVV